MLRLGTSLKVVVVRVLVRCRKGDGVFLLFTVYCVWIWEMMIPLFSIWIFGNTYLGKPGFE
jgi:hypothetical protein